MIDVVSTLCFLMVCHLPAHWKTFHVNMYYTSIDTLYIWTVYIDGLSPGANTVLFWAIVMVITTNHIYTDSHAKGYIPINGCGGSPLQNYPFPWFYMHYA